MQILIVCLLVVVMGGSSSVAVGESIKDGGDTDKFCSSGSYPKPKNMIEVEGFYVGMNICDAKKVMTQGKYSKFLSPPATIWYRPAGTRDEIRTETSDSPYVLRASRRARPITTAVHYKLEGGTRSQRHDNEKTKRGRTAHLSIDANSRGEVSSIQIKFPLVHDLFKSKGMSLIRFAKTICKNICETRYNINGELLPEIECRPVNVFYSHTGTTTPMRACTRLPYRNGEYGYRFELSSWPAGATSIGTISITGVAKESEGFGD